MAKQLTYADEARQKLLAGVSKLARAVRSTLGPRGRNAVLDKGWGSPNVTKDGVTVAEEIELQDPYENMGAQLVKEAASKTSDVAGDGTTTATVLAEAIYREGLKMIAAGHDPMAITRGIQKGVEKVVEELHKLAEKIDEKDAKEITEVATIASNNHRAIGEKLAEAMKMVGKDGVITIEEGKTAETVVDVVQGMQFDRGYLSPHFVTNQDEMTVELENPYILIYEEKISSHKGLLPLLEQISQKKVPLLIIAEDVEGEALATLVLNKLRGILQVCAVKAPGYGDRRKAMLEDIATLTGGQPIFKDLGIQIEGIKLTQLGRAKKVKVDAENTTITEGAGDKKAIDGRAEMIRREVTTTDSEYDREKLQERLAAGRRRGSGQGRGRDRDGDEGSRKARCLKTPCTRPAPPWPKASSPAAAWPCCRPARFSTRSSWTTRTSRSAFRCCNTSLRCPAGPSRRTPARTAASWSTTSARARKRTTATTRRRTSTATCASAASSIPSR